MHAIGKEFACRLCMLNFTAIKDRTHHESRIHGASLAGGAPYRCTMCAQTYKSDKRRQSHLKSLHKNVQQKEQLAVSSSIQGEIW